jgi:hypothetical protein
MENKEELQEKEQNKSQKIWDICCLGALFVILIICCYLLLV